MAGTRKIVHTSPSGAASSETPAVAPAQPQKLSAGTFSVTDSAGRVIEYKMLGVIQRMRLLEMVGAQLSSNDQWLGYATLAAMVVSIDGDLQPSLTSKRAIEALVSRLDEHGLQAVAADIVANRDDLDENGEPVKGPDAADLAKNG